MTPFNPAPPHEHDAAYVNESDHTKAAHDSLAIDADTVDGQHAAAFATASHLHDDRYVELAGDAMSGPLTLSGAPTQDSHAATKAYVDAAQAGLDVKQSVRLAATQDIALASAGLLIVDGVQVTTGNRVLVKNQTTGSQNGIYTAAAGAWTRATDADANAEVTPGLFVFVEEGLTQAATGWVLSTNAPITLDTTALAFTQFSGAGAVAAGAGLLRNANVLSADFGASTGKVAEGNHTHPASAITNSPGGNVAATNLQAAVNELDSEKAPIGHTHTQLHDRNHNLFSSDHPDIDAADVPANGEVLTYDGAAAKWKATAPAGGGGGTAGVGSIDGVTPASAGGNIDLIAGTNVTITPDDPADSITIAASGGAPPPDASTTTKGISKLSSAPAVAADPVAVGGNDPRVPLQAEKNALAATNGAPSDTNRYVTDSDPRNTNPRTPAAHAATHQPGGSDALAVDATAATGSLRTLGTGATQAAPGNDARFTRVAYSTFYFDAAITATRTTGREYIMETGNYTEYAVEAEGAPAGAALTINIRKITSGGATSTVRSLTLTAASTQVLSAQGLADAFARGDRLFIEAAPGGGTTTGAAKVSVKGRYLF